jgi:hypothetical protein
MTLEDLAAIGVVANDRPDEDYEYEGTVNWQLTGDDGVIIAGVFEAFQQSNWGWDEMCAYTSTSPQEREEESSCTGGQPTFRPTPDDPPDQGAVPPEEEATQWDFTAALGVDDTPTCWQCGKELVWTDEQRSGVCSRCDPEANLWREEEARP